MGPSTFAYKRVIHWALSSGHRNDSDGTQAAPAPIGFHDSSWRYADFMSTPRTSFGSGETGGVPHGAEARIVCSSLPLAKAYRQLGACCAWICLAPTTHDLLSSRVHPGHPSRDIARDLHSLVDAPRGGGSGGGRPARQRKPSATPDLQPTIRDGRRGRAPSDRIKRSNQSNPVRHLIAAGRISIAQHESCRTPDVLTRYLSPDGCKRPAAAARLPNVGQKKATISHSFHPPLSDRLIWMPAVHPFIGGRRPFAQGAQWSGGGEAAPVRRGEWRRMPRRSVS